MIELIDLTKEYSHGDGIHEINLKIEKPGVYGLLGPNGAGKSTLMNVITGYLGANSGDVFINGYDIFKQASKAKKNIGYLPEIPPLYPDMTVTEYLRFVAELKGVAKKDREGELLCVMEMAQVSDVENKLIRKLSKGYKQRVGFAQALMGSPEVIILDEPTVGLDPIQINEFRETIRSLKDNHIVIISSHILAEINEVCDYVFIISKGKLVLSDSVDNLSKHFKKSQILNVIAKGSIDKAKELLEQNEDIESFDVTTGTEEGTISIVITSTEEKDLREWVSMTLSQNGILIFEMKEKQESLEEVFMEITSNTDEMESENDMEDSDDMESENDMEDSDDMESEKNMKDSDDMDEDQTVSDSNMDKEQEEK